MSSFVKNFDRDKADLARQIESAASIEDAVILTDGYLSRLHRDICSQFSLKASRDAEYLLEILRYAIRALTAVDKVVRYNDPRKPAQRPGRNPNRFFAFIKLLQSALILTLLTALVSASPVSWISVLLVLILSATEIHLHFTERKNAFRFRSSSGSFSQEASPQMDVHLKVAHVHTFLNAVADALAYADKALTEKTPEKEAGLAEIETPLLKIFQDLFEASAFHDGEWALKKIPHIQIMLREKGIIVKAFDPMDPADRSFFDMEPAADPSVRSHITIRPAFIRADRVLLRGRAAEPFSANRRIDPLDTV